MSDGTRLHQSWYNALNDAEAHFRKLLTTSSSPEWKRILIPSEAPPPSKGKGRASTSPELTDVVVHRKSGKSGDNVWRAVLDIPVADEAVSMDSWKSVLVTPELRKEWDPAVENAQILEVFDHVTRIAKTNFTLGWPANPRDSVTISRTFNDATTVIDISTSLPRSPDEPAYLRPSPPYVRSHVKLFAWCIQYIQPQPPTNTAVSTPEQMKRKASLGGRLRITCFWQHDVRSLWSFGSNPAIAQQLASMLLGLEQTVKKRGARLPVLTGYGIGVTIERVRFAIDREALTVDYAIIPEEEDSTSHASAELQGFDELHARREAKRLTRAIECELPSADGWDVQITTKASRPQVAQLPWTTRAIRSSSLPPSPIASSSRPLDKITFDVKHSTLPDDHSILKVRVHIELSASSGLRLNGLPQKVEEIEERDPASYYMSQSMLQDATSTADLSFTTASTASTVGSTATASSHTTERPNMTRTERTPAAEKSILSRVKRNYIYFSSLLQEPEAKWKRTTEARGVEIKQLDSIDPTLVVYRAEATFVGVGIWDLYAAIVSPGARAYWDKLHEDATLLEDVNDLSELWHYKTKPAWPVVGRDVALLTTVYKSPSAVHVFSFSADDPHLFPNVPPALPTVIRTQVDLYGWSIEALSPTTTLITLLEQSDPKGWSNKASIPQQMIATVAGMGEFAIKCGGPPVATRLAGAKATQVKYDHERGQFRIEYAGSASRRAGAGTASSGVDADGSERGLSEGVSQMPLVECELRCDVDVWGPSLDIVVDPPPQSVSALRRHRLSAAGGGLWLTITHDAVFAAEERILAIVRRGPGREKGVVMVNGARVAIDVEELQEAEVKLLAKQKRSKPVRIPLDQPPVLGVIRRRRAEWDADAVGSAPEAGSTPSTPNLKGSSPRFSSPLTKFITMAMESATSTTQQAVAAMSPPTSVVDSIPSSAMKPPMAYALDTLSFMHDLYSRPSSEGWTLVSDKGFPVHRKLCPEISPSIPVHKGEKVIECVSAEEVAAVLTSYGCRKQWDDRFDSATILQAFGAECHTAFVVSKGGFPFRDRGFYLASLTARSSAGDDRRPAIFVVSASFGAESAAAFRAGAYNPYALPVGRMLLDGWLLETVDPYGTENFAIPSTRCTRLSAVDYAGALPAAVNSMINAALPRTLLAVEAYIKTLAALPITRLPPAGLVLSDKRSEGVSAKAAWTLRRRDQQRTLVMTSYTPETRTYRSVVVVTLPGTPLGSDKDDVTPRPSRIALSPARADSTERKRKDSVSALPSSPRASTFGSSRPGPDPAASPRDRSNSRTARTASSAFTLRGEVRPPADLVVAELVLDAKLYADGCQVTVAATARDPKRKFVSLGPSSGSAASGGPADAAALPLAYTLHTLPSSPLHSSGLNADRPTRHLLRATLPTAQFLRATLQDPLTGEVRTAPPKPQWYLDLQESGAVVDVLVEPTADAVGKSSAEAAGKGKKGGMRVTVGGVVVPVASENDALAGLGRDELTDDRVSKMSVLLRSNEGGDQLPADLEEAVGVADHLLDPSSPLLASSSAQTPDAQEKASPATSQETLNIVPEGHAATHSEPLAPTSNGLLGFLQSYPNPLLRLAALSPRGSTPPTPNSPSPSRRPSGQRSDATSAAVGAVDGGAHTSAVELTRQLAATYPLSVVLVVALIAFLMGSLLRSLLSPADFIYLVTDPKDVGDQKGWREIRRLVEIKYIMGGWDFQIAVVRRH